MRLSFLSCSFLGFILSSVLVIYYPSSALFLIGTTQTHPPESVVEAGDFDNTDSIRLLQPQGHAVSETLTNGKCGLFGRGSWRQCTLVFKAETNDKMSTG